MEKGRRVVSYALFGFDRDRAANCFDFNSYLRGMQICLRFNRLLFPEWQMTVHVDQATWDSPYRPIFDWHASKGFIRFVVHPNGTPLCRNMLWRLDSVFEYEHPNWRNSHIICRDLDSIPTYREAQMVEEWIREDKALHCITDSVSHTIPMMGGMIGLRPGYVNDIMKLSSNPSDAFESLMNQASGIDFRVKGSDQDFLNRVMYPKLCQNACEHFILGMPHNLVEGNGRHYSVPDVAIETKGGLPLSLEQLQETNRLCGHVGAAGFYEAPTMKFLYWDDPFKEEYAELESMPEFRSIFYWHVREDLR